MKSSLFVATTVIFSAIVTQSARAADPIFHTSAGDVVVETVAHDLVHPWSLAFLPDGQMLVTERPGRMRIVNRNGALSKPLPGVPRVFTSSQAGLLDVILANDFAQSRIIYFCYAEPSKSGGRLAVAHAKLIEGGQPRLDEVKTVFRQRGPGSRGPNIACRIVQARDGNLFVTLGDHFQAEEVQKLDNDLGKIIRISSEGKAPHDNPFIGREDALPEIWAYGLRNAEGLAFNPATGELWEQEHGPKGGDEINIIEKGANYGWAVVSFGVNYDGTPVGTGKQHHAGMVDPIWHWTPSIATSGMAFYTGDLFPMWKGSIFNGALAAQLMSRLELDGNKVVKEERMLHELQERIRDVRQGPDGALYLLTDNADGRILRVVPADGRGTARRTSG